MVKLASFCAGFIALCFCATQAYAITAEDLRGATAGKSRDEQKSSERAKSGSLTSILPDAKGKPRASKYGGAVAAPTAKAPKQTRAAPVSQKPVEAVVAPVPLPVDPNIYIPPVRTTGADSSQQLTDSVVVTISFGVRLGSWVEASLNRNTTSGDSGAVELTVAHDLAGDRRTLPAGTLLFANKSLNSATRRMELQITNGITPDGQEFEMHGTVFDVQRAPGLAGNYIIDDSAVVSRGATKGILAGAGAALAQVAPGVGGAAVSAGAQSISSDANRVTDSNAPQAIIYISPQPILIRVEKQF